MRAVRIALLMACIIWTINAESNHNNSSSVNTNQGNTINHIDTNQKQQQPQAKEEPLRFTTKAKDTCNMVVSSQANFTKLRVSCKSKGKSYWCDFLGKPNSCKAYNNNPSHFFTQMMWDLRKLHNACQGQRVYKPQMCRSASDEVQMSFHASWPKIPKQKPTPENQQKQQPQTKLSSSTPKPARQQPKPAKAASKPVKSVVPVSSRKPIKITTVRPTMAAEENDATKLAEEYCWSSLQGVCSYVISWFQN